MKFGDRRRLMGLARVRRLVGDWVCVAVSADRETAERLKEWGQVELYEAVEMFRPRHRKSKTPVERRVLRFPGYVFVKPWFWCYWPELLRVKGVRSVLGVDGAAVPIHEDVIVSMRGEYSVEFYEGDRVEVLSGMFKGQKALYFNDGVMLKIMGKDVKVNVPKGLLIKID